MFFPALTHQSMDFSAEEDSLAWSVSPRFDGEIFFLGKKKNWAQAVWQTVHVIKHPSRTVDDSFAFAPLPFSFYPRAGAVSEVAKRNWRCWMAISEKANIKAKEGLDWNGYMADREGGILGEENRDYSPSIRVTARGVWQSAKVWPDGKSLDNPATPFMHRRISFQDEFFFSRCVCQEEEDDETVGKKKCRRL